MKSKTQLLSPIAGSLAVISSLALILFLGTACQTKKGAKDSNQVGNKVTMSELRNVIQTQISDPAQSAILMNMTRAAENELKAINKDFIVYSNKIGKITVDHSKGANDLQLIIQERKSQSSARRLRLVHMMLDMRSHTTPKEWPIISNAFINSATQQSDHYKSLHHASNS